MKKYLEIKWFNPDYEKYKLGTAVSQDFLILENIFEAVQQ